MLNFQQLSKLIKDNIRDDMLVKYEAEGDVIFLHEKKNQSKSNDSIKEIKLSNAKMCCSVVELDKGKNTKFGIFKQEISLNDYLLIAFHNNELHYIFTELKGVDDDRILPQMQTGFWVSQIIDALFAKDGTTLNNAESRVFFRERLPKYFWGLVFKKPDSKRSRSVSRPTREDFDPSIIIEEANQFKYLIFTCEDEASFDLDLLLQKGKELKTITA